MADPRTVLQRLLEPANVRIEGRDQELRALVQSVRSNLEDLLGTRQGSSQSDADYGIPDLTFLLADLERPPSETDQHAVERMADLIARAIRKHEPRFEVTRVRAFPDAQDPFALRFEIAGQLMHEGKPVVAYRIVAAMRDQHLYVAT